MEDTIPDELESFDACCKKIHGLGLEVTPQHRVEKRKNTNKMPSVPVTQQTSLKVVFSVMNLGGPCGSLLWPHDFLHQLVKAP